MHIPDYISPLVAYRTWQWDDNGLLSLNHVPWPAGEPLAANTERCTARQQLAGVRSTVLPTKKKKRQSKATTASLNWLRKTLDELEAEALVDHVAPADNCTCGIYAAKNFKHLEEINYVGNDNDYGVHGEVYLWGRIWDHSLGYRAQYAYPKNLTFSFRRLPWTVGEIERRLLTLTKYGVDMFLQPKKGDNLLLWSKETGFNPRAFEPIIADRTKWYLYREKERRLEPGGLLAILGLGLGIIQHLDETKDEVHVLMFNTDLHKISVKSVLFDQHNYRWETTSRGTVTQFAGSR